MVCPMDHQIGNRIWINGVELEGVVSGDVSFVEGQIDEALQEGGDWVTIELPGGSHYRVWISNATQVVTYYAG